MVPETMPGAKSLMYKSHNIIISPYSLLGLIGSTGRGQDFLSKFPLGFCLYSLKKIVLNWPLIISKIKDKIFNRFFMSNIMKTEMQKCHWCVRYGHTRGFKVPCKFQAKKKKNQLLIDPSMIYSVLNVTIKPCSSHITMLKQMVCCLLFITQTLREYIPTKCIAASSPDKHH